MAYPMQGVDEAISHLEAMTGKTEEQLLAAAVEQDHGGDYAAACRKIALLEMTVLKLTDQNDDLQRRMALAEHMASMFKAKAPIGHVEQVIELNRDYETDPATESFLAGKSHLQRVASRGRHAEDLQIKQSVKAWFTENRTQCKSAGEAIEKVIKYEPIGKRKAEDYLREWVTETGFVKAKIVKPTKAFKK